MSDFLSKFNKDKYQDLLNEQGEKNTEVTKPEQQKEENKNEKQQAFASESDERLSENQTSFKPSNVSNRRNRHREAEEEVEIDLEYRKKKRRRVWIIVLGSVCAFVLIFIIYYQLVHVKVEDFSDLPVSDARVWGKENDVEIELTQEYSMQYEANRVLSQSVAKGEKIRKGKTLELVSSLGPDPEETIPLADFSEMSLEEAESWIEDNKAENLQMVMEYSDDIEEDTFIKMSIKDNGIDESEYKRKDSAAVYYSKGKEIFEKNINIPDFTGKPKEEVEKWVESNEIEMTYEESDSNTIEAGNIISQSEEPDEKIAKRDKMKVTVSLGEATVVPNFAELSPEEAATNYPDLLITIKQKYSNEVSYGALISQSVEAGTKLTEKDDKNIMVTYSEGSPYLRDFRGLLEGDLPKMFYEEYESKGADIKYLVKYVDSTEVKGTVVDMGVFNEFVPMTYTVEVFISNNASAAPSQTNYFEDEPDISTQTLENEEINEIEK